MFQLSSTHPPDEPQSEISSPDATAVFTVQRDAGAFTSVVVSWAVQIALSADISPISATVSFDEGEDMATFSISALPDMVSCNIN